MILSQRQQQCQTLAVLECVLMSFADTGVLSSRSSSRADLPGDCGTDEEGYLSSSSSEELGDEMINNLRPGLRSLQTMQK